MTKNFDAYLKLDKTALQNKYVIIVNGVVVAKGENIEEMLDRVRQEYPHEIPFVAKVPDERMLIYINVWWDDIKIEPVSSLYPSEGPSQTFY